MAALELDQLPVEEQTPHASRFDPNETLRPATEQGFQESTGHHEVADHAKETSRRLLPGWSDRKPRGPTTGASEETPVTVPPNQGNMPLSYRTSGNRTLSLSYRTRCVYNQFIRIIRTRRRGKLHSKNTRVNVTRKRVQRGSDLIPGQKWPRVWSAFSRGDK